MSTESPDRNDAVMEEETKEESLSSPVPVRSSALSPVYSTPARAMEVETFLDDDEKLERATALATPIMDNRAASGGGGSRAGSSPDDGRSPQQPYATPPRRIDLSGKKRSTPKNHHRQKQQQQQRQRPETQSTKLVEIYDIQPDKRGKLVERWDPRLPRPPSNPKLREGEEDTNYNPNSETVCVFNANTKEGSTIVKVLSAKKINVIAVVRVFTSPIAKHLMKLNYVTVKVASWNDKASLLKVAEGCTKGFIVTKYWEKFENQLEEQMAMNILQASKQVGITQLVLANFEDTALLKTTQQKSQLMPILRASNGKIYPKFKGMKRIYKEAKKLNVLITNMMTTYFSSDVEAAEETLRASNGGSDNDNPLMDTRKSLTLIRSPNGEITWSCSNTQDYSPRMGM